MADTDNLTLQINKVVTSVDNDRVEYNSSERGKVLEVQVVGTNHVALDLTGKTLRFVENKKGGKIVVDDQGDHGNANAGAGVFTVTDAKAGRFTYQYSRFIYQASGEAWFEIYSDSEHIDTTQKFYIDIENGTLLDIQNDNYVSSIQAELAGFKSMQKQADNEWQTLKNNMDTGYQARVNEFDTLKNDWQSQTNKINSDAKAQLDKINANATAQSNQIKNSADAQHKAIQDRADKQNTDNQTRANQQYTSNQTKADNQLKAENDKFNSTLADQVKQIEAKRDAAISDANKKFNDGMSNWANTFTKWLTDTKNSYNADIAGLKQTLKTVQDGIRDVDTNKYPQMLSKVAEVEDRVKKAQANFDSIDFSSYAKKADMYTKTEVDRMIANAGKLKTISVNGGTPMNPDDKGNVNVTIPKVDLSGYYTKTEVDNKVKTKAEKTDLNGVVKKIEYSQHDFYPDNGVLKFDLDFRLKVWSNRPNMMGVSSSPELAGLDTVYGFTLDLDKFTAALSDEDWVSPDVKLAKSKDLESIQNQIDKMKQDFSDGHFKMPEMAESKFNALDDTKKQNIIVKVVTGQ